jgi:phytoene desaturase
MEKHLQKNRAALPRYRRTKLFTVISDSFFDYLGQLVTVPMKHSPLLLKNMWKELCESFESKEARMIFSLVGFFLGRNTF